MSTADTRSPDLSTQIPGVTNCDACGLTGRPQVAFKHPTRETIMAFCGHHTNAHATKLTEEGWAKIADLRSDSSAFIPKTTVAAAAPVTPAPVGASR